jgi:hypothetical protein
LPLPFAPAVTVIHGALLAAVQLQLVAAVTETVPLAAADDVRFEDEGESEKVHGSAACVTVNVPPPIVIVPVRDDVIVFAATM